MKKHFGYFVEDVSGALLIIGAMGVAITYYLNGSVQIMPLFILIGTLLGRAIWRIFAIEMMR